MQILQAGAGHVRFQIDGNLNIAVVVWPERYEKVPVASGNSPLQCRQLLDRCSTGACRGHSKQRLQGRIELDFQHTHVSQNHNTNVRCLQRPDVCAASGCRAGGEKPLLGMTIRNSALEQRLVRTRTEQERVATYILNSAVQGCQTTTTETRLKIYPDQSSVRFELFSMGEISSQTTGVNSQAMVDSTGVHHFEIAKPFWFNGTIFLTQSGHGTIRASQAPQRVVSAVGTAMPLLRPLSDRIAWEQVNRRQAQINQAVVEDVSRTLLPKIDRIIDQEFAQLGQQLAEIRSRVESAAGAIPLSWLAQSSDTSFSIVAVPHNNGILESRFNSVAVNVPPIADGEEIAFAVSDEMATALLQRFVPGGLILTDTQVEKASKVWNQLGDERWSVASLLQLLREMERNATSEAAMFSIQLAKVQPLAIRFDRGDVCIESSFQIIPRIGTPSGWMKTTWRLRGRRLSDSQWAVALHQVDVGEAVDSIPVADAESEGPPSSGQPELRIPSEMTFESDDTFATPAPNSGLGTGGRRGTTVTSGTVWMSVVRNATQSMLNQVPAATFPKQFDVPTTLPDTPRLRLVRIESAEGTLRAAFRLID